MKQNKVNVKTMSVISFKPFSAVLNQRVK